MPAIDLGDDRRVKFGFFADPDTTRYAGLRLRRLKAALGDAKIVGALAAHLGVSGDGPKKTLAAAERKIEELTASRATRWYGAPAPEVLAASIFEARALAAGAIDELFSRRASVQEMGRSVAAWLQLGGFTPRSEEAGGAGRMNLLGYQPGGHMARSEAYLVAATNDVTTVDEAIEYLDTSRDRAHALGLACTPAVAAEYLLAKANARSTPRWDGEALTRRLKAPGHGLLLVEGDAVALALNPVRRDPSKTHLEALAATAPRRSLRR